MKTLVTLSLIIVAHTAICAQETDSKATQWGSETNGIQLGINLAQGVQATNSNPVVIKVHIKNNSTNAAHYYIAGKEGFDPSWHFTIISPSGEDISPRPIRAFAGSGAFRQVDPGQTAELEMDLKSRGSFEEEGEYKITLKQKILILRFNDYFDVESNSLILPIVKGHQTTSGLTNSIPASGP